MSAAAAAGASRAARGPRALPREPALPLPLARGLAFFALAAFGGLHWMVLLEPSEPRRALWALGAAGLAVAGLLAAARLPGLLRPAAATIVALGAVALAIVAGGVADELLRPDRWGALLSGIGRGLASLPGIRVPYRGLDEWARIVLAAGGTVLTVCAALAAFWPRRTATGRPGLALGLLVALYAVPAVALDFTSEFLRGAALTLLVLVFLRLERLRAADAGAAACAAAGAAVLALLLAPALDGDEPWWDYESWAQEAASARSTAFSWDHSYGALDWPRDGRELLRVRARRAAYWKAANLGAFDGLRWAQADVGHDDAGLPGDPLAIERNSQRIEVRVRNLTSESYVAAGFARSLEAPTIRETPRGDGTWIPGRALRRGDAYSAVVYTPQPNGRERREAARRPPFTPPGLARQLRLFLPGSGDDIGQTGAPRYVFDFPRFGDVLNEVQARQEGSSDPADRRTARIALTEGPYRRTWALAQRLAGGAQDQEDFVQAVLDHLADGYAYTEVPGPEAMDLDGFLFDARAGYCQQFSGAMALLLRMGGVPARVATGFTSGSQDPKTREFVVRDLDAHSWVEVWYDGIGWVTFDPTPATAPPRAQPDEAGSTPSGGPTIGAPDLGGDAPADPGRRAIAAEGGTPWAPIGGGAGAGAALLAGTLLVVRRRRRRRGRPPSAAALDELERALRRARRHPGPGTTLSALEARFAARSPAAAGYVRAVRELRYGGRPGPPTRAQRRGLRAELARGGGLAGRLRAWWALPPRTR